MFISIVYFMFITMWGLNYHRLSFGEISGLNTSKASIDELELLCEVLINRTNRLREKVTENENGIMTFSYQKSMLYKRSKIGYNKVSDIFPELSGNYGIPKGVFLSEALCYMGITGIYFPFTGEANVNTKTPAPMLPATICHEMAHQRGFAREDEANYIAYLTCNMHPDIEFKYSGNLLALIHSMNALYKYDRDRYIELAKKYTDKVYRDLKYIKEFWKQYEGPLKKHLLN
nr:DUF3810 domain-containing protein [Caldisalinibacter kiritimatiensis]